MSQSRRTADLRWIGWTLVLLGCDGPVAAEPDAVTSAPPSGSLACPTAVVTGRGIGSPCRLVAHCAGLPEAPNCPYEFSQGYPDFCTRDCIKDKDCAPGAFCRRISSGVDGSVQFCAPGPEGCADSFDRLDGEACSPDQAVNEFGLGKPCNAQADCKGLTSDYCPVTQNPKAPRYCVHKCACNDDCNTPTHPNSGLCIEVPEGLGCDPAQCHIQEVGIPCEASATGG